MVLTMIKSFKVGDRAIMSTTKLSEKLAGMQKWVLANAAPWRPMYMEDLSSEARALEERVAELEHKADYFECMYDAALDTLCRVKEEQGAGFVARLKDERDALLERLDKAQRETTAANTARDKAQSDLEVLWAEVRAECEKDQSPESVYYRIIAILDKGTDQ